MKIAKEIYHVYEKASHIVGRVTKEYYVEDFIRVYPDGLAYYPFGIQREATQIDLNNFRNHLKFYLFAAQAVKGKRVADAGCGSGYGCEVFRKAGATEVFGVDASKKSVEFAVSRYGGSAKFIRQSITDMSEIPDDSVDVTTSSEVLEHIKEYNMEEQAIRELKRITKKGGLLIVATPNAEMLKDHGFYYSEMKALFEKNFSKYCIFENALIPFGTARAKWETRLKEGEAGVVVSQSINLAETVLPEGVAPEIKRGIDPGMFDFGGWEFDTGLLHNTHSWIVLAVNGK